MLTMLQHCCSSWRAVACLVAMMFVDMSNARCSDRDIVRGVDRDRLDTCTGKHCTVTELGTEIGVEVNCSSVIQFTLSDSEKPLSIEGVIKAQTRIRAQTTNKKRETV